MNLKQLTEEVTKSKFNKYISIINKNDSYRDRLSTLDFEDNESVEQFCEDVFGEPKGLYINTVEEQKKLLKRIQVDVINDSGDSKMMRPVYSEI